MHCCALPRAAVLATMLASAPERLATPQTRAADSVRFDIRVENVSGPNTLRLSTGGTVAVPVSPGVWAVHTGRNPIFTPGEVEPGRGLKGLAEAGMARAFEPNLRGLPGVRSSGFFSEPLLPLVRRMSTSRMSEPKSPATAASSSAGGAGSRMLQPGQRFEFTVTAQPGDRLSLAMMIAQSNDALIATGPDGIALFDASGRPLAGNITSLLLTWDAGTEVNEEPGVGRNQGLRQGAPHAGDPERRPVRPLAEAEFGSAWPEVDRMVRVTVTPSSAR
jgi:hypothetical protein